MRRPCHHRPTPAGGRSDPGAVAMDSELDCGHTDGRLADARSATAFGRSGGFLDAGEPPILFGFGSILCPGRPDPRWSRRPGRSGIARSSSAAGPTWHHRRIPGLADPLGRRTCRHCCRGWPRSYITAGQVPRRRRCARAHPRSWLPHNFDQPYHAERVEASRHRNRHTGHPHRHQTRWRRPSTASLSRR